MTADFRDLHYGATPLVLPNAWDVPSALAFVDAGFVAVGTTSFGVAASRGHPDGARNSKEANLTLAAALATVGCLVSVDIEDGYADDPVVVADYVARLGVAGVNIEDSTHETLIAPGAHAAKALCGRRRGRHLCSRSH
jgi:2-methylisocitrate lyase-like PEP mutase family enzyme